MTEWISPIDGHRHFSDAGRVGCAVCELEAERDRLRAALRAVMAETGTSSLAHHYARDALVGSAEVTDE